jgi:hypothetical protein
MQFPSSTPQTISDPVDLHLFVSYLRQGTRTRPVVLLTVPRDQSRPVVGVDAVEATAGGRADIVTMATGPLTLALAEAVGKAAGAFDGACRIYPPGSEWLAHPYTVPLYMARTRAERQALPAIFLAALAKACAQPSTRRSAPVPAAGSTTGDARPGGLAGADPAPTSSVGSASNGAPPESLVAPPSPGPRLPGTSTRPAAAGRGTASAAPLSPGPRAAVSSTPPTPGPPVAALPELRSVTLPRSDAGVYAVTGRTDAAWLGSHLVSPDRVKTVVVVTRASGKGQAFADAAELASRLEGVADVFEVTNAATAWALTETLPPDGQTYGGMTRVYPPGRAWVDDTALAPLSLAFSFAERKAVTAEVTSNALRVSATLRDYQAMGRGTAITTVDGQVIGLAAGRALVQLDGGGLGVIWPELVADTVPPERLFTKGMRVGGPMDADSRIIDVGPLRIGPADALAGYVPGLTVPVRVHQVEPTVCRVELFPGLIVPIDAAEITNHSDLRLVTSRGEILLALIVAREADTWLLSVREAADAIESHPAASLLPGGPPWLLPQAAGGEDTGGDDGSSEADSLGAEDIDEWTPEDLADALAEIGALRRELAQATRQVTRLGGALKTATEQLSSAKTSRRQAEIARDEADRQLAALRAGQRATPDHLFDDARQQLDFEIRTAWAHRIPAAQKPELPLAEWCYSEHFFDTLTELQGVDRGKIVDVLVEVLTGLDAQLSGRDLHQLRSGAGGSDPPRVGPSGESYWRVSLQTGTPGARRLHYGRSPNGRIVFSSVRHHDDLRT